jgi:4-hydroxythreonine-4-phosphate dehydrogenase
MPPVVEIPKKNRPRVAITIGDPAGIGPEITLKVLRKAETYRICIPIVIGASWVMQEEMGRNPDALKIRVIQDPAEAIGEQGLIDFLETGSLPPGSFRKGEVSAAAGIFGWQCMERAVSFALAEHLHAVVMGPYNKQALDAGGYHFAGWSEIVRHLTKTRETIQILMGEKFHLARVTTHVALRQVPELITRERVRKAIVMLDRSLKSIGFKEPRIAVSALNPHGGEGGLFGREEMDAIQPAVEDACQEGVKALGPFPGDTVFLGMRKGHYDIVLSMYHDHGGAAIKLLEFGHLVNLLAGVPIRVFSVSHGTAFDIAGKGVADETNLERSIQFAAREDFSFRI